MKGRELYKVDYFELRNVVTLTQLQMTTQQLKFSMKLGEEHVNTLLPYWPNPFLWSKLSVK